MRRSSRRGADRLPSPRECGGEEDDGLHCDEAAERERGIAPEGVGEEAAQRLRVRESPAVPREEEAVEAAEEADRGDGDVDADEGCDRERPDGSGGQAFAEDA